MADSDDALETTNIPYTVKCGRFFKSGVFSNLDGTIEKYGQLGKDEVLSLGDAKNYICCSFGILDDENSDKTPELLFSFISQEFGTQRMYTQKMFLLCGKFGRAYFQNKNDYTIFYHLYYN